MSTTRRELRERLERLRLITRRDLFIEYAGVPQRPRVFERIKGDDGNVREISPRLTRPQMSIWMDGFYDALQMMGSKPK